MGPAGARAGERSQPLSMLRPAYGKREDGQRHRTTRMAEGHRVGDGVRVTLGPEEIRTKLETGRAAIASRLRALADEIEALPLVTWLRSVLSAFGVSR